MNTTRPFGDAQGNSGEYLQQASAAYQPPAQLSPEPFLHSTVVEYKHPFKVEVSNGQIIVYPGWVYSSGNGREFDKIQVKLNGTDMGDPFTGGTMPQLAVSAGLLWIKCTIAGATVTAAEIVYEVDASAKDDSTHRWILVAETATSGAIKQYLKSDVFVVIAPAYPFQVLPVSASGSTGVVFVSDGYAMNTQDIADPTPALIWYPFKTDGDSVSVSAGDTIFIHFLFASATYNSDVVGGVGNIVVNPFGTGEGSYDYISGEFTSVVTGLSNDADAYFPLASVDITSGVMTLSQIFTGGVIHLPYFYRPVPA